MDTSLMAVVLQAIVLRKAHILADHGEIMRRRLFLILKSGHISARKAGMIGTKRTHGIPCFFAEYGNYGAGAGKERAPFVKMLTEEEAAEYTRENVLGF